MEPSYYQQVIEPCFTEVFDGLGVDGGPVSQQRSLEHGAVPAFDRPGRVDAIDRLQEALANSFGKNTSRHGPGMSAYFNQPRASDGANPIHIFDRFEPVPKIEAAGITINARPLQPYK